jgi:hypothetical protein
MESSAGQALAGIREQPGSEAIVPVLDDAFSDSARLTGFVAFGFILFGLGLSVLLPETRPRLPGSTAADAAAAAPM